MSFLHTFLRPNSSSKPIYPVSSIDIVNYAVDLASNPRAIDPFLDEMRVISSQMQPGETLTRAQQKPLKEVYLKIEHYLTTQDPIHQFKLSELRQKISDKYHLVDQGRNTFWADLPK